MTEKVLNVKQDEIHYWVSALEPGRATLVFLPGLTVDHAKDEYVALTCHGYRMLAYAVEADRPEEVNKVINTFITEAGIAI